MKQWIKTKSDFLLDRDNILLINGIGLMKNKNYKIEILLKNYGINQPSSFSIIYKTKTEYKEELENFYKFFNGEDEKITNQEELNKKETSEAMTDQQTISNYQELKQKYYKELEATEFYDLRYFNIRGFEYCSKKGLKISFYCGEKETSMPKSKLERLTDYDQLGFAIIHFDEQLKKIDLSMLKPYKSTAMIQSYTGNSFDFVPADVILDFLVKNDNVEFTNPEHIT